jgi:hypothetical protein
MGIEHDGSRILALRDAAGVLLFNEHLGASVTRSRYLTSPQEPVSCASTISKYVFS